MTVVVFLSEASVADALRINLYCPCHLCALSLVPGMTSDIGQNYFYMLEYKAP